MLHMVIICFVRFPWVFIYTRRLVAVIIQGGAVAGRPFHGCNRGSNPRGDAIPIHPQGSYLGGFLLQKPRFLVKRELHESPQRSTLNHDKPQRNARWFVETSWSFLGWNYFDQALIACVNLALKSALPQEGHL